MSTLEDTLPLTARLFALQVRIDRLAKHHQLHAGATAVYIDLLGGLQAAADYLSETDAVDRELAFLGAALRRIRSELRTMPLC